MKINNTHTHTVLLDKKGEINISIRNEILEQMEKFKYLVIIISSDFLHHVGYSQKSYG